MAVPGRLCAWLMLPRRPGSLAISGDYLHPSSFTVASAEAAS